MDANSFHLTASPPSFLHRTGLGHLPCSARYRERAERCQKSFLTVEAVLSNSSLSLLDRFPFPRACCSPCPSAVSARSHVRAWDIENPPSLAMVGNCASNAPLREFLLAQTSYPLSLSTGEYQLTQMHYGHKRPIANYKQSQGHH